MTQLQIFELLRIQIEELQKDRQKPLRVAINGVEGTGKTFMANSLASHLKSKGLNAMQVTIDGFHHPQAHRYRQGRDSAKGYYEDSYDEQAFVKQVLLASQKESPTIIHATHDLESDQILNLQPLKISHDCVLITDGAYLFKPAYRDHWDLKIYLKTNFETALQRGIERDEQKFGSADTARQKFLDRYHKASRMYIDLNQPESLADIIIDNTHFDKLTLLTG